MLLNPYLLYCWPYGQQCSFAVIYYFSQTIQLSNIKFNMHVYADGVPIHMYFQIRTSFTFVAIDEMCILVQP